MSPDQLFQFVQEQQNQQRQNNNQCENDPLSYMMQWAIFLVGTAMSVGIFYTCCKSLINRVGMEASNRIAEFDKTQRKLFEDHIKEQEKLQEEMLKNAENTAANGVNQVLNQMPGFMNGLFNQNNKLAITSGASNAKQLPRIVELPDDNSDDEKDLNANSKNKNVENDGLSFLQNKNQHSILDALSGKKNNSQNPNKSIEHRNSSDGVKEIDDNMVLD